MACAPTDGVGVAAWAAPWPPRTLVDLLVPRLRLVTAVTEEEWQSPFSMASALTDGVGVVGRATPPPPLRAPCSPGAAIMFDRRLCQGGGDMPPFVMSIRCLVLYTLSVAKAWGGVWLGGGGCCGALMVNI